MRTKLVKQRNDGMDLAALDRVKPRRSDLGNLQRIAGNTLSILSSDVLNRATTFVMYALVARYLGAFEFGQMSLALTFFYTFQVFSVAGLKTLITREVAKNKTETDQYLVNGSIVVAAASLLSMTILLLVVRLLGYATDTASIILLLSLGLFPYALSAVCEGVFQAWERMQYIAYANIPANIAKVSLTFLIMSQGYGLYHLVGAILATFVVTAGVEWWLMLKHITKPRLRIDIQFSLALTRTTVTFLGIDVVIAMWASITTILLSKLASEIEVGLFNAAAQLTVPVRLVFGSVVLSIFPLMSRRFETSLHDLKRIAEQLVEILLAIALPTAVGLFFLADEALLLLYGEEEFVLAAPALRIMAWGLVLTALTTALGHVLLAGLKEKVTLRIVAINAVVNLVLGLIFISWLGLTGAAIAVLLTGITNFYQHYVPVSKLLSRIALGRLAWKPFIASVFMAGYFILMSDRGILLTVVSAGLVYVGVLFALMIWSSGGLRQLRAQYLFLRSE